MPDFPNRQRRRPRDPRHQPFSHSLSRRLSPERWAQVERAVAAQPEATQQELAHKTGVSRSTVGRVVRARRAAEAIAR
jgi:CRP-like cAMP-binding protein